MTKIKAIFWDHDGVITDTVPAVIDCFLKILHEYDIYDSDEKINGALSVFQLYDLIKEKHNGKKTPDVKQVINRCFQILDFSKMKPVPGIKESLESVKEYDVKNIIATNSLHSYIEKCFKEIRLTKETFDKIITAEDVKKPKPDPEMILLGCKELGLKPDEVIFIDDTATGVMAGINAGTKTILFTEDKAAIEKTKNNVNYVFGTHAEICWDKILNER